MHAKCSSEWVFMSALIKYSECMYSFGLLKIQHKKRKLILNVLKHCFESGKDPQGMVPSSLLFKQDWF